MIWTLGLRNRLCSHHGIVSTTANTTNIFSITFLRLLFFVVCSAGVTADMRNRKRNHQRRNERNRRNEQNEVPKLNVCSSETAGTTKTSPTKQAIRLTIMVETSKRWKVEEISSMSVRLLSRIYGGNFWKRHFWQLSFCRGGAGISVLRTTVALEYPRPPKTGIETKPPYFSRVNVVFVKKFSSLLFLSVFFFCFSWQTAFWSFALHCDSWRKNLGTVWFSY